MKTLSPARSAARSMQWRKMRGIYSTAYHELQALAEQDPAQIGFLFAYDLCCDAIAAIRRGAWPAQMKKKSLEAE